MKKRPLNTSHAFLLYIASTLVAAGVQRAQAQLLWNDATGPTANWSTTAGDENWLPGNVVWTQNEDAVFGGTAESIDVTTLNTVDDMTFHVNGYTISSLGAGSLVLSDDLASTITVTNATDSAVIAETMANNAGGASSLTKAGLGTLILTGANTYSGGTLLGLNAGTLNAATAATAIHAVGSGPVSIGAGSTMYLDNTKTTNIAHVIPNTFTGTGTLQMNFALSAAARNTTMNNVSGFAGTIRLSSTGGTGGDKWNTNGANAPLAAVIVENGSQLFVNGTAMAVGSLSMVGTGNSEGRGALRLTTVALSGNITLAGSTTFGMEGGTANGNISSSAAGLQTLTLGTATSTGGTLAGVISNGSGVIELNAARGTVNLTGANTFTGKVRMGAAGPAQLNVSSLNKISGGTASSSLGVPATVADGTIDAGSGTNGGTLNYTGTGETTDRVLNLSGTIGGAALTQSGPSGILGFSSAPTATGAGGKTLTLNGSTAGTAVLAAPLGNIFNNGALLVTAASAAFATAVNTITVDSVAGVVIGAVVSGTGITGGQRVTSITGTGPFTITLSANTTVAGTAGQAITFTPAAALAKNGTGTWTLGADNTYDGTTSLTGGVLIMGHANALGSSAADSGTQQSGASELRLTGGIITAPEPLRINGGGINNLGALRNFSGDNTYSGTITMAAQSRINSDSGTLLLNHPTAVTGSFNLVVGGAGNMTISGGITNGTGGVLKADGTGILTLAGVNTFTGASSINLGTLRLDYTTNDTSKLSDTTGLTLGGGTLEISGGTHNEIVGSVTLTAGTASTVTRTNGATGVLNMNTITPGASSVVNFTGNDIATTNNLNTNGLLGNWATVTIGGVTEWATNFDDVAGGRIRAYAGGYADIFRQGPNPIPNSSGANVRIVDGGTIGNVPWSAALTEINSLKMDAPAGISVVAPFVATDVLMIGNETGGGIFQTATSGSLQIGTAADDGDLTTGLTVNGQAASLNIINDSPTNVLTINSRITNNGTDVISLGKSGAGRLVLNGSNTFTGNVAISSGTVQPGSASALGTNATVTIGATGTLDLNANNTSVANLAGNATGIVTDHAAGAGTTTLSLTAGGGIATNIRRGATRDLALSVTNQNGGFFLNNAANTFSGGIVLTNSGAGTRMSPGTIVAGAYGTGTITVGESSTDLAGIYFATANQTLTNPIIANTGRGTDRFGTFRVDGTGIVLSGTLTAGAADLTFSTNGTGGISATGQITGPNGVSLAPTPHDLTTARSLTLTLNNPGIPNDYAGNTTINNGALAFKSFTLALGAANQIPNGLGRGDVVINSITGTTNGIGRLNLGGFSDTINGLSGTTLSIVDGVSGTPTLTIGDGDVSATYNGTITDAAGALAIHKIGTGTQTFTGANTYAGPTTVSAGSLVLFNSNTSPAFNVASGAVLEVSNATLVDSGTTTINGAGTLRKMDFGTLQWGTSAATFALASGSTIDVQGGTFVGGSNANENWTANLSDLNVAAGAIFQGVEANVRVDALTGTGTITSGFSIASYQNFTFGVDHGSGSFEGVLADGAASGNFVKDGMGKQTLTNTSSYTGTTRILKGELNVNGNISSSSLLTADNSGTLSGSGTVGNVSVLAGGIIAPGNNSPGTLFAAAVDLLPGSTCAVEITAAATADKLAVTGALAANGTIKVTLSGYAPVLGNVFDIADGTISGSPGFDFSAAVLGAGLGWDTSGFATDGTIRVGSLDDPFNAWANLNNITEGKSGDDDKDGVSNLLEFATNSDAKSSSSGARVYGAIHNNFLTFTVATRKSAAFAPAGVRQRATRDKIIYTVEASDDLSVWNTVVVTELNAVDSAIVQATLPLPVLQADWEWHTFRTDDTTLVDNRDMIRLAVAPE